MQKLSNETKTLLKRYEATLYTLENKMYSQMQTLPNTLQDVELSYMNQNFQTMLENIRQQKIIISRNLLW